MLNPEIISGKLLIITILISVVILIFLYSLHNLNPFVVLHICNADNKLNLIIQTKDLDILVNPVGEKQVLSCLGKVIPFYDREIEYVFSNNSTLLTALSRRYKISSIESKNRLKMADLAIVIDSNIIVRNNHYTFDINQKNNTAFFIQSVGDSEERNSIELKKGQNKKYALSLF